MHSHISLLLQRSHYFLQVDVAFLSGQCIKIWEFTFNFGKELSSDVSICATLKQEVLLCLHLSLWTELTQPVFSRQPGLSVAAGFHSQTVSTQPVPDQSLSESVVTYGAQVFSYCVLSV